MKVFNINTLVIRRFRQIRFTVADKNIYNSVSLPSNPNLDDVSDPYGIILAFL